MAAAKKMILQVSYPLSGSSAYKTVAFSPTTSVIEARDVCAVKGGIKEGKENYGLCIKDQGTWLQQDGTLEKYNLQNSVGLEFKLLPKSTKVTYEGDVRNIDIDFALPVSDVLSMILEQFGEPKSIEYSLALDDGAKTSLDNTKILFEQAKPGCKLVVKKKSKIGVIFRRSENLKPKNRDSGSNVLSIKHATKIFGVPLLQVAHPAKYGGLPGVVAKTIEYLEETALQLEGIFRISGNQSEVLAFKKAFDEGQDVNVRECSSPHVAAGLLKLYLREMPEPLFMFNLYDIFIAIYNTVDNEECRNLYYKVLIDTLPIANQKLLYRILPFLAEVVKYEHINKMAIHNVATVFGPNMLRSEDNSAMVMIQGTAAVNAITCDMIKNYKMIIQTQEYDFCSIAEALFSYEANSESELSLKAGDIVFVVKEDDTGWWEGEVNGNYGFFPTNYVKTLVPIPKRAQSSAKEKAQISEAMEVPDKSPDVTPESTPPKASSIQKAAPVTAEVSVAPSNPAPQERKKPAPNPGMSRQKMVGQLEEIKAFIQSETEYNESLRGTIEALFVQLETLKNNQAPSRVVSSNSSSASAKIAEFRTKISVIQSNIQSLNEENELLTSELDSTRSALDASEKEIDSLRTEEDSLKKELSSIQEKISTIEEKVNAASVPASSEPVVVPAVAAVAPTANTPAPSLPPKPTNAPPSRPTGDGTPPRRAAPSISSKIPARPRPPGSGPPRLT